MGKLETRCEVLPAIHAMKDVFVATKVHPEIILLAHQLEAYRALEVSDSSVDPHMPISAKFQRKLPSAHVALKEGRSSVGIGMVHQRRGSDERLVT